MYGCSEKASELPLQMTIQKRPKAKRGNRHSGYLGESTPRRGNSRSTGVKWGLEERHGGRDTWSRVAKGGVVTAKIRDGATGKQPSA